MAYASTNDVAAHLGRSLTEAEATRAALLLNAAEAMISARVADIAEAPTNLVILVEAMAVARVLRNPDGRWQETISSEYSFQADKVGSDGVLRITDDEWAILVPPVLNDLDTKAFTIVPGWP